MTRIDDVEGKLLAAVADDGRQQSVIGEGAAAIAALITPFIPLSVLTALSAIAVFAPMAGRRKSAEQLRAMNEVADRRYAELGGRVTELERKTAGPEAEEALNAGGRASILAANDQKPRMFGVVLGTFAAKEAPNWNEATEFIRNIEQFTNEDIHALKILWHVQRTAYRVESRSGRSMSMRPDDYRGSWSKVMERAKKAGISDEDWLSRCGRLSGFGLTMQVNQGTVASGSGAHSYRLTTKAVRLLDALGFNVDPGAYPKVVYAAGGVSRRLEDEDEHRALDGDWFDTPQP